MRIRTVLSRLAFITKALLSLVPTVSQGNADKVMRQEDTEVWTPVPPIVAPGEAFIPPPSDAVVLFDGSDLSLWQSENGGQATWQLQDGHLTVKPGAGDIVTRTAFASVQLYLEWRTPAVIEAAGQGRGNSGVFLQDRYELQVLDSYDNATYVNGMAGRLYKQAPPRVNAARRPGEWQSYQIAFVAPEFSADGSLRSLARVTVFWNGVLIHHDVALEGPTVYIGHPAYEAHGAAPIRLQDHGDAVSYRNIWIRKLDARSGDPHHALDGP